MAEVKMVSATTSSLNDEQVAEIKKIFSAVDVDGSGSISASELGTVLQSLAGGAAPSPAETDALMKKMDTDGDGAISWAEFLAALTAWLKEEDESKSDRPTRKRKDAPQTASSVRVKIHKQISGFFMQFKRATDFDAVRAKYAALSKEREGKESKTPLCSIERVATAAEKAAALTKAKERLGALPRIAVGISGEDPAAALACTEEVANILYVCEVFQTAEERYEIADFLITIFQRIQEASIIPRIVKFLSVDKMSKLQYEAARVLTYFGPGPRIAHTPPDSVLHPSKMMHKTALIESGAVHQLVRLLGSPAVEVREQATLCIGKLVSHDWQVRDFLLSMGVFDILLSKINDATPPSLLNKVTWAVSIFCGHTHSPDHPPPYDKVAPALPKLAYLFQKNDEAILANVCTALSFLLPGIVLDDSLCSRLVQLLGFNSLKVQRIVLQTILDMVSFNADAPKVLLKNHLLPTLRELLRRVSDGVVRLDAVDLISIIAAEKGEIQGVIDADLIPVLVNLILSDEVVRFKVVKVLNYLTRGIPAHVTFLVERADIVNVLSNSLQYFKSYDSVLRDVYNFLGPSYNFEFVHDVCLGLLNIIKTGDLASEPNPYVKYFGMDCVEKIKRLMMTVAEELTDEMDAWRKVSATSTMSLEEQLVGLLAAIKSMHERARLTGSAHISEQINESVKQFQATYKKKQVELAKKRGLKKMEAKTPAPLTRSGSKAMVTGSVSPGWISVKCFFDGDNRVLEVARDVTLKTLSLQVNLKYGKPVVIQYEDDDGDKITIDSQAILEKALAKLENDVLKLYLLPAKGFSVTPATAAPLGSAFGFDEKSSVMDAFAPAHSRKAVLNELQFETKLSRHDLERLYNQFQKTAVGGVLDRAAFARGFRQVNPNVDSVMIDQFFNAFDYDKDGRVDFRDFAVGLSTLHKGSAEERLQLAFKAYDLDGNGSIDRSELFLILKSSLRAKGFEQSDEFIQAMVEKCFEAADLDGNGTLDFEEFKHAVLQHQIVVQSFWRSGM